MSEKSNRARTRAVRKEMSTSGSRYTQAARKAGAPVPNRTDQVRVFVRSLLVANAESDDQLELEVQALEAKGHRIVDGGQTGATTWEIIDWRTRETIETGDGGWDGYAAATDRLNPSGTWIHFDQIDSEPAPTLDVPGVPDSLAIALDDWVSSTSTSDLDIAEFIGWTEDKVSQHR